MTEQAKNGSKADQLMAEATKLKNAEVLDTFIGPMVDTLARGLVVGMQDTVPFGNVLTSIVRCTARMAGKFYGGPDTEAANKMISEFRKECRVEFSSALHQAQIPRPPGQAAAAPATPEAGQQDNQSSTEVEQTAAAETAAPSATVEEPAAVEQQTNGATQQ